MSVEVKTRRGAATPRTLPAENGAPASVSRRAPPTGAKTPYLLDFFPLEGSEETRLSRFFDRLRQGRLSTTRCPADGTLLWPPRTACPKCHREELEWVDLPEGGRIYAFSAVLGGAPLGMERDVPFAVGLIDLDGAPLRLFGRIEGRPWVDLHVGDAVRVEPYPLSDGRVFYRFRAVESGRATPPPAPAP
ncbi:MAG: Zn-ribbon domain-containing OB-fold protein [Thermoplasmata archaeon]